MQQKCLIKIQNAFVIKTFNKLKIESSYLKIMKARCESPTATHHTYWRKIKSFSKPRILTLSMSTQTSNGRPTESNQATKRRKNHPKCKERGKIIPVCRKYNIMHRKILKISLTNSSNY